MKRAFFLLAAFVFCAGAARAREIVFASYNVENYLLADDTAEIPKGTAPKSARSVAALIRVIQEINPDILGVCEMGRRDDFEDFKNRLREAGLGYIDFEYVDAADQDRHLALLSRFPISARQSCGDVPFDLDGRHEKVKRGFLDVTIAVTEKFSLRLVGAHLKSKRDVTEGEALLRRCEAHLLRRHVEEILARDERGKLVVYGDFNDAKNETSIQEIAGPRQSSARLTDLSPRDRVGDCWTHFWKAADLYARIDYIFVNRALRSDLVAARCGVYRSDFWSDASDHRPVFAAFSVEK